MNAARRKPTVRKTIAAVAIAAVAAAGLTPGPAWAAEFTRGAQQFDSTPVASVGAAESAFVDNAADWSGSTETAANGGDWTATDLSHAGSWSHGGSSGAYAYSYGMRVPPATGPTPGLTLSYSSAAHDGLTSGTNNQASWIGDGWGYSPGFIERTYAACGSEPEQDGNNGEDPTGDLCWDDESPAVTMSLNGANTALVLDDDTGKWRAASDTNWRIELIGSPASSSTATSERWKITVTDGTQYFFAAEPADAKSRWTVPVFGNHSGEPCYDSGDFADSYCAQAYRWMLDKVVDVHGNMTRYTYGTETGYYSPAVDSEADAVAYTRSGWLKRIEYGLRSDDSTVKPTGRVQLIVSDRCLEDCHDSSGEPETDNWPDVPWDLDCETGDGCEQYSPVFFSTKRLAEVTTEVWNPAAGVFDDVDSWTLTHEFKDYGDKSQVVLWLAAIQHTGHVGGTESMPAVEFGATFLPNRVDDGTANPAIWRPRLTAVKNETGGVTTINYSAPDCGEDDLPTDPEDNTQRCYPAWYTPDGLNEPVEGYFHKYVVSSVAETDSTGGGDAVWTHYEYSTAGGGTSVLWAWNDAEYIEEDKRTYNDWRGYAQVTTLVGDPADAEPQLRSAVRYYRGLDDQPLPDDTERSVSLTSTQGQTVTDHEALVGQVWEQITYEDTTVIGSTTTRYWTDQTAVREHDGGEAKAWMIGPNRVDSRTKLSSTAWRTTQSVTTYDDYGRATEVSDLGDPAAGGDEQCVRTEYADNTAKWLLELPSRIETVSVDCDTAPSRPADVVGDVRAYYDGQDHGAAPSQGLMTKSETLDQWNEGPVYATMAESTFDALGREINSTDALGAVSTTAYTPAGAGPVTHVTTTNPLGHADTAAYEPAWGAMLTVTTANAQTTSITYDPLGRRTAVWLPGQDKVTEEVPNIQFSYTVSDTAPSAVTTETMIWDQSYLTKIELYDALLRPRQTQADTYEGRLVTQTVYNSRGQVAYTSGANFNNESGPTTDLVRISRSNDVARTEYVYDAAGRATDQIFVVKDDERWRTTTAYGGHDTYWQTTVTPPDGASAVATLSDARGKTVELHEYQGSAPTGEFDTTSYDYTAGGLLNSVTDPDGNEWSFTYDLRGRQIATDDPDTGHSTTTYNNAGQVTAATNANGTTLSYEYDALGRKTARWEGPTGTGTLLSEWAYDAAVGGIGLPHSSTNWINGQAWTQEIREYQHGRPVQTYTTLPEAAGPLEGTYWQAYTYRPDGSLRTSRAVGAGGLYPETMTYRYDEMGQPTRVTGESPQFGWPKVYVDEAIYSPYGQLLQRRLGDPDDVGGTSGQVWQTWIYEEGTGRLAEFYFDKDTAGDYDGTNYGVAALAYEYDPAGNVLSITDEPVHTSEALAPETQCFQYDHRRRLTEAWSQPGAGECADTPTAGVIGGPASYWSSYAYDTTGNRISEDRWNGTDQTTYDYTYPDPGDDQPHALTKVTSAANGGENTIFTYDDAGFTTSIDRNGDLDLIDWTPTGRLETVASGEDITQFIDDAAGNRLARLDHDGSITAWVAGYELHYNAAQDSVGATRYYTHGGETIAVRVGRGDIQFLSGDHHGTSQWIVNGDTLTTKVRRYDPFGNNRSDTAWVERDGTYGTDTWPDERGFIGGIDNKTTGLTTIGAREYDPIYGRFISVDPIADWSDAQQLNGYAYALNNPVTFTDPTGLSVTPPQKGMIPTWCGGSPVTCTGWHFPADNSGPGNEGQSNDPGSLPPPGRAPGYENWIESYANCGVLEDTSAFGNCMPPVPDEAQQDELLFVSWYCWEYGISDTSCSYLASLWGLDVPNPMEDSEKTLTEFGEEVAYLLLGDYIDCANAPGVNSACGWSMVDLFGGKVLKWGDDLWFAIRTANKACNSFVAGTLVVMADGSIKPIEEIGPGDEILSAEILTGKIVKAIVSDTVTTSAQLRDLVTISADEDGHVDSEMTATAGHAFWSSEPGSQPWSGDPVEWTPARVLEAGSLLQTSSGTWVEVASIEHFQGVEKTYNLSVLNTHVYFVMSGGSSLLAHNCGPSADEIRNALSQLDQGISSNPNFKQVDTTAEVEDLFFEYAAHAEMGRDLKDGFLAYLPDGTVVTYRYESGSGGAALSFRFPEGDYWKVHIPSDLELL